MTDPTTETPEPSADPQATGPDEPARVTEPSDAEETAGAAGTPAATEERSDEGGRASLMARLEQEGEIAADYLEGLLDIADLDGDIDMDVEGQRATVSIVGADLNNLVGANGEVLDALQELTRLAVQTKTGERSRLMLDISGFRARRREQLAALGKEAAERVRKLGEPVRLEPMTPFERKVVHDAVAAAGLTSESEGVEPQRFVVVLPAAKSG